MGELLASLIADSAIVGAATMATIATVHAPTPAKVAVSQESQHVVAKSREPDTVAIRSHLMELARVAFVDVALVEQLAHSFLRDCDGMADGALRDLLCMLGEDADRRAGRVPDGDTAVMICPSCGPVYVHPSIATVLPIVDGWPRALGCQWCFISKAGLPIPHPTVSCGTCRHFERDCINSAQGMGRCAVDAAQPQDPPTYPATSRDCGSWRP